jgi:pimeloyl-ACP methyl ester carboxylesterase
MTNPEARTASPKNSPEIPVEFLLRGEVTPPFIFLNGFRMPLSSWGKLMDLLPTERQMFFYNRAGVGRSPKANNVQTAAQVVDDLRALLGQLRLKPPYIVVAHSLGGVFANYFARQYPQEVAGMILVEASHPDEIIAQRQFRPPALLHWLNNAIKAGEKIGNPYKYSEDEAIDASLLQIAAAGEFPDIPLCIISGAQKLPLVPRASFDLHCRFQQAFLQLSPQAEHHTLRYSGHFPQLSEPEGLAAIINSWLKAIEANDVGTY